MIDPSAISALKVYPPIGVARVGNAQGADDYFIGPEMIGAAPTLPGTAPEQPARFLEDFRTANGEIKRQAARFRIYAHLKDGSVQEVTESSAKIEWRVNVANLKAGWYEFNQAMDLGAESQNALKRNRELAGPGSRWKLDITPTPKDITGKNAGPVRLDDGSFWASPVYLGELRTDNEGRLIFLGGNGVSRPFRSGTRPLTFANNPGWHDDVCDGPVRAQVTFAGHAPIDAEPGYVCVTPPNYAPGLFGLVTMDDVLREVFYDKGWIPRPVATSFVNDVLPVFQRLTGLQWINHGLFVVHGFGSPLDVQNAEVLAKLSDGSAAGAAWRGAVFALFRDPDAGDPLIEDQIAQAFGDGVDQFFGDPPKPANSLLAVTRTQYAHLKRWAAGTFDADGALHQPAQLQDFSALSPEVQVENLERASLHDCLGGPFHPAMEMTWVMRIPLMWSSAYRLKVLPGERPARQDFGNALTPAVCTGADGPHDGVAAGCLTRFLGVPWQTDHTSCNSAADYFPSTFLSMPTFWGPRAPDQVLADGNYRRAAAIAPLGQATQQQTFKHLMNRVDWLRDLRGNDYYDRLSNMIAEWAELGMVLPVKNPPASLPVQDLRVEQGRCDKNGPIDVTTDSKYQAVEDMESLFSQHASAGLAPRRGARKTAPPPKRTYRQGEI